MTASEAAYRIAKLPLILVEPMGPIYRFDIAGAEKIISEAITTATADLRKRVEWQPIESAPLKGLVFAIDARGNRYVAKWSGGEWVTRPGGWRIYPTHWQPLPEPHAALPASQEREGDGR